MADIPLPPDFNSLISLLDDPDNEAFRQVSELISSLGPMAVPSLEAAWEQAYDPVMQARIENLVHQIQFSQLLKEFNAWVESEDRDLCAGYTLITRYQYPDLNTEKLQLQVDHLTRDIWLELNPNLTALEQIRVFNHMMFLVFKFGGISTGKPSPENFYLNILLESKQGTPLSLGLLYLIIAQKLNIPVQGIDLPNHFVAAYTNMTTDGSGGGMDALEVRFYINPFARGAIFSAKELNEYLKQLGVKPEERFFYPCSNLRIISRLIRELKQAYRAAGNEEKAEEMNQFLALADRK